MPPVPYSYVIFWDAQALVAEAGTLGIDPLSKPAATLQATIQEAAAWDERAASLLARCTAAAATSAPAADADGAENGDGKAATGNTPSFLNRDVPTRRSERCL